MVYWAPKKHQWEPIVITVSSQNPLEFSVAASYALGLIGCIKMFVLECRDGSAALAMQEPSLNSQNYVMPHAVANLQSQHYCNVIGNGDRQENL